jgi:putative methionine-R-sulfoxide reductase with GAF domain
LDHYSILGEPEKPSAIDAEKAPAIAGAPAGVDVAPVSKDNSASPAADAAGNASEQALDATLKQIAGQAQYVTGASGAAIALKQGKSLVCRAASGTAPEVGTRLQLKAGLTAECIRTGEIQRCDNAFTDERVDRESCARLGIESIIVMPLFRERKLAGIFEVFARQAYAFQERDVETLRGMAEMVTATLARAPFTAGDDWDAVLPSTRPQLKVVAGNDLVCATCGGISNPDTLECEQCGRVAAGISADPESARDRLVGFLRAGSRARLILPLAFLLLAAVLVFTPMRRHSSTPSANVVVTNSPPLQPVAPDKPLPGPAGAAAAPATASDSSVPQPDNSLAGQVKTILGGVRSDVVHLLASNQAEAAAPSTGDPQSKVWVDTRKGIYYCRLDAAYAKTPRGVYMTQRDAQASYYTPALQKNCD